MMHWARDEVEEIELLYDSEIEVIFDSTESTPEHPRDCESPFYCPNDGNNYASPYLVHLEMRPGVTVDIPQHVQNKHFMSSASCEKAIEVSLKRDERRKTNTVFQSTQKLYRGVIKRKSHDFLFEREWSLYISGTPLECYECMWHQNGTITTNYVGFRYAVFSGDHYPDLHFLRRSKEMKPKNFFFTLPKVVYKEENEEDVDSEASTMIMDDE